MKGRKKEKIQKFPFCIAQKKKKNEKKENNISSIHLGI